MSHHIVFVSYNYWPPDFGGELLMSIERFHAFAQRGFDVKVLTSGRPGFASQHMDGDIPIRRSPIVGNGRPTRLLRRVVFAFWAAWHLLWMPINVLHIGDLPGVDTVTSTLTVWLWVAVAKLRGARAVIAHSLADSTDKPLETSGWRGWWRAGQFRVLDRVVSNTPALQAGMEQAMPGKSILIMNGVRSDYTRQVSLAERQEFRLQAGLTHGDEVAFVFEGSIGRRKGFDTLAQAFAASAASHPNWRLWVIGPYTRAGSQNINLDEVHQVIQPVQGLESQVTFLGRIDDRAHLRNLLHAADVFVFPSRREGLGVAHLEAMGIGLPLIISHLPGATDLANIEGETGFFIQPGDMDGLQQAMLRLGQSSELRRTMGAAARERIVNVFGWEDYLKKWESVYTRG
jgi:glycosyltransferase involved in cell wall biosynthesis